ncbi:MAG: hypothetical protein D3920_01205 [Candidatus Electrothrix sp. AW2]|nr:hypothetical protein [Candidatus Electrothrix gigas]MCI5178125.1 hypothetical protein [Candidatus Electrothrix gigas]
MYKVNILLAMAILLTSTPAYSVSFRNDIGKKIRVSNGQVWGEWRSPYFCPYNSYVVGFSLQVEGRQGDGDDTALNNVRLICSNGSTVESPGANNWGNWGRPSKCGDGYLSGFSLKVEGKQGDGDDTAANSLGGVCSNGAQINAENGGDWGRWGGTSFCPSGMAVCGAELKIEPKIGDGDDTAVNDVALYCCPR